MSSSKRVIADQVMFKIQGGYPDVASPVQYPDVYKAMEQKINSDFKTIHFAQTLAGGETIPEHAMMATYEDITVSSIESQTKSEAILPVQPISLIRNMGVYDIYDTNHPEVSFIPLRYGQQNLLKSQPLINDLLGQVGYSPKGNKVIFDQDLLTIGVETVDMVLLVMDFSTYEDSDALNLPPDYESNLVDYLVKIFAPVVQGEKDVDVYTEPTQPIKK